MLNAPEEISFGIYACSAEDSSFLATFTDMEITDCVWKLQIAHGRHMTVSNQIRNTIAWINSSMSTSF